MNVNYFPSHTAHMKLVLCMVRSFKPKFHYADFATKLRQSPGQIPDKVADLSRTKIMKVRDTNHVADFHDLCPRQVRNFVGNLSWTLSQTLSPTFPVHCNGLNSIRATQMGLSRTCHRLCRKHLDMSRWFVSATFVICVGDFHRNFTVS